MYRVELDGRDDVDDLVAVMADYAGASYETHLVLETESQKLADAVGALMGKVVESDRPRDGLPEIRFAEARADLEMVQSHAVYSEPVTEKKTGKKCEFCDKPRKPRSKTCGDKACDLLLNKKHQAAYQARKEAKNLTPAPLPRGEGLEEEAATSESPLGPLQGAETAGTLMYQVVTPDGLMAMTYRELMQDIAAKRVAEGTRIRAQPSGLFYEVRNGTLGNLAKAERELPGLNGGTQN